MFAIYSAELFPTVLRSQGVGLSNVLGRIGELHSKLDPNKVKGSVIAPVCLDAWQRYVGIHPMAMFGVISFFSILAILLLPETHDSPLLLATSLRVERPLQRWQDHKST